KFLATLGGAAAAWPLAARAQQREKMRRIVVLMNLTADDPQSPVRLAAFLQGLRESGWTDGRNVRIEYLWGANDVERSRKHAGELVTLAPAVILASGSPAVAALQQATPTYRSCSCPWSIRSAAALSTAWRDRVVISRDLRCSNTASAESGWSYSRKLRRV